MDMETPKRRIVVRFFPDAETGIEPEPENFDAHVPQILPDGGLQIIEFDPESTMPWTVALFANGAWRTMHASMPSMEDINKRKLIADELTNKARAKAQFEEEAQQAFYDAKMRGDMPDKKKLIEN